MERVDRAFPGFAQVHSLHGPLANRPLRASLALEKPYKALRAEVQPEGPVEARWAMGSSTVGDVVWTTSAGVLLISARLVDLLKLHGFTSWSTYPVRLTGRRGEELPPYHGLSIHGPCGALEASRRVQVPAEEQPSVTPGTRGPELAVSKYVH